MVEESDYSTPRMPSVPLVPAPGGQAHARRVAAALSDPVARPASGGNGSAIGVVLSSDRQLRIVRTTRPRGLRLEGEIDLANIESVRAVLASAARDGVDITLDLSRLRFVDVAGLRVFVESAEHLAGRGGRLVLTGASRQVVRVLRLCGWAGTPGLHVADGPAR